VLVGNKFGKVYCINAADGKILWSFKTGHSVESTPVFCPQGKAGLILVGSQDRSLYALESETGEERWSLKTGDYISATAALAMVGDRWIACVSSLDNHLYVVDAGDGKVLAKIPTGEFIWSHYTRYDSHWSSPAIGLDARGKPMVVFGSYDGFLYRIGSATEPQHSEAQARAKSEDIK
jgi:outer membrane protein assembly factor BamB